MDWRSHLVALSPVIQLRAPAEQSALVAAATSLRLALPDPLVELLLQTNGVLGEYDLDLVWPIERIVADNQHFRNDASFAELYMPFDSLLFFGDAGNGDQFAFPIRGQSGCATDVFVWDHENDSRRWIAPSLQTYLQWWLDGTITL